MASQPRPPATTTSTCTPQTARGRHVFQIDGYSLHRGFAGIGKFVQSAAFTVGGYSWCIRCYPDGASKDSRGHVSVFLRLVTRNAKARVLYDIRLVGRTTGSSPAPAPRTSGRRLFDTTNSGEAVWGRILFIKASELEASAEFLRGNRLVIECDVTVIGEPLVTEAAKPVEVEDEYFFAHRVVLGARSQVFCAELCGTTKAGEHDDRGCIAVAGMQPPIFKALLRFIYTDSLPAVDDLGVNEIHDMARNLFLAADKYAMERLKVVCTGILCRSIDDATVDSALALADQYDCGELRDICIKHIDPSSRKGDHAVAGQQAYRRITRAKSSIWVVLWEKMRSLFRFK
ncbi:hypothetical protein C2845_PM14G05480 [Panicum miliaceum]|uniref:BTB/POZ and MATH domain-containing protein 1-like n=1 Tax=Panicum miliaceum TaxID=4540 RepID=A0A3L6PQE2_PANMI|nr:hypothetical protein C2845_PM14G05480 [Panicum miliaceum]